MHLKVYMKPVAKGRPRFGKGKTYTPQATVDAEQTIRLAFKSAHKRYVAPTGPLEVSITVQRALPAGRPKRMQQEQDVFKPDLDNYAKLVIDALNGLAWKDDSQIVTLHLQKLPRARCEEYIEIRSREL